MARFRPGMNIRFTYKHFWPLDANSRDQFKDVLILHTNWQGKVHGIDLKALNPAQLTILKYVMNPVHNRIERGEGGTPGSVRELNTSSKEKKPQDIAREQIEASEKQMLAKRAKWKIEQSEFSRINPGQQFPQNRLIEINNDELRHKANVDRLTQVMSMQDEPERIMEDQSIPPQAKEILRRMKPAKMVNNPHLFYNAFIRPFLNGVDAYRTFFYNRMEAIQEVPRWYFVRGQPITPKQEGPGRPRGPAYRSSGEQGELLHGGQQFLHGRTAADIMKEANDERNMGPASRGGSQYMKEGLIAGSKQGQKGTTYRMGAPKKERVSRGTPKKPTRR